jgi:hypothetical protein
MKKEPGKHSPVQPINDGGNGTGFVVVVSMSSCNAPSRASIPHLFWAADADRTFDHCNAQGLAPVVPLSFWLIPAPGR